ncbi:hypothetical protein BA768_09945 [Chryseobacterium sp. CBo1]|uniref:DUF1896 family protein n=1 Tax=Chryseobacterium sp. CBo1 TaxID=1869230 RepID=UPI0008108EDF|nr:hypothetical protein BA768_09945 [Chryseobacterium sp. CBo1]
METQQKDLSYFRLRLQELLNTSFIEKEHDRFLIIDNTELYHIRASLKGLGKVVCLFKNGY